MPTNQTGAFVGNLCFGHSYGFLDADLLWEFEEWMTYYSEIVPLDKGIEVMLNWDGRLPYPTGDGPPPPKPRGPCGMVSAADGGPIGLVSLALLVVWARKRRGRSPEYT